MLVESPLEESGGFTHRMRGPKQEVSGFCDHVKGRHVARSHEEIESLHVREPDLSEGVSMRVPMGDMSKAIDDGVDW